MRGALGNSLLLNLIITFILIIIVFFSSVLIYSKAYRAKNRVIEVIEKYGEYNSEAEKEISTSLGTMGYQVGECNNSDTLKNNTGYKYCVEEKTSNEGRYYKVTTYVQFYFPVIREIFSPAVTSETKILGKSYDY